MARSRCCLPRVHSRAWILAESATPREINRRSQDRVRTTMPWVEVFVVFLVSHLVGDYMLQTEWQALNKRGALKGTPTQRRALLSHIATYTLAFVPCLVWLWP